MGRLVEDLEPLEDPRHGNAERHSLHDILVIALSTNKSRQEVAAVGGLELACGSSAMGTSR